MFLNEDKNIAVIDGQNLYMGTAKKEIDPWEIDLIRFRIYLQQKYHVVEAYYFLGCVEEGNRELYEEIQKAGFVLIFRQHTMVMTGKKKGNVDTDIVFHIMKKIYKQEGFLKIILVSGDGDYKLLVDFLIEEKKFLKILFPNRRFASSLYKSLGSEYFDHLENPSIKNKIELKKKRAP
jgi:uncharacterized LabA/DUF88 family protein